VNDALLAADRGMVTIIVLLDYSAAFDTVDHSIAVDILQNKFGVTSSSLQWFCNYLSGRSFSVSFNSQTLQNIDMDSSLPQGCTLGPLMYITYVSELQAVTERHGVVFHSVANDTQLSKATRVEDIQAAKHALVNCIKSIRLEQLTSSEAQCSQVGGDLAWHASTTSHAQ